MPLLRLVLATVTPYCMAYDYNTNHLQQQQNDAVAIINIFKCYQIRAIIQD